MKFMFRWFLSAEIQLIALSFLQKTDKDETETRIYVDNGVVVIFSVTCMITTMLWFMRVY